jgi:hypothetical protein
VCTQLVHKNTSEILFDFNTLDKKNYYLSCYSESDFFYCKWLKIYHTYVPTAPPDKYEVIVLVPVRILNA